MNNVIPVRFKNNIAQRPTTLPEGGRANPAYNDLAATLEVLDPGKAVQLSIQEAEALFGKYYKSSILANLKKRDIKKPRIGIQNETVYIYSVKV